MSFFKRIGRIISGTANNALESMENPEIVIPQQIREMEESKRQVNIAVAECIAEEKRLERLIETNNAEAEKWHNRAINALKANNELDAEKALKEENRIRTDLQTIVELEKQQEAKVNVFKDKLRDLETKINAAKSKSDAIIAQSKINDADEKVIQAMNNVSKETAFESLDRMESKVNKRRDKLDALNELGNLSNGIDKDMAKYDDLNSDISLNSLREEVFGEKEDNK